MKNIIEVNKLSKVYPRGREKVHALTEVDLDFTEGEFVSLVGPSGSGKTTLLNLIGCLDVATSGYVKFNGKDITGLPENKLVRLRRNYMGFVFQHFYLLPTLTVRENIELPLLFSKKKYDSSRIKLILEMVDLDRRANHLPSQLSGGEMQRAAIGRALVNQPLIIFADEPTGNLDSEAGRSIFSLFNDLNEKEGITIITATHNRSLAETAKRTIHLLDGKVVSVPFRIRKD